MEAFLTGFAIAVGVNLFVFPLTSRTVVFKEAVGYIAACQGALKAQAGYLQSLEREDMFNAPASSGGEKAKAKQTDNDTSQEPHRPELAEAVKLNGAIRALSELHGKLCVDLTFAKREMAFGNLSADDIDEMFKLFRTIFLSVIGMSSVADIFERVAERRGWTSEHGQERESDEERKKLEKKQWNEIMKTLHNPFEVMTEALTGGLQHVLYTLELAKPSKKEEKKGNLKDTDPRGKDIEAHGDIVEPGHARYATYLSKNIDEFYEERKITLAIWCKQKGIDMDADTLNNPYQSASRVEIPGEDLQTHQRNKRQLYLILYVSSYPCVCGFKIFISPASLLLM